MGQCKDCKWWFVDSVWGEYDEYIDTGMCILITSGIVRRPTDKAYLTTGNPTEFAGTVLMTKSDFGCNQFEAKSY